MSAPVYIVDPKTGHKATVSEFGQLTTAPVDYSTPVQQKLDVINSAYTMIKPVDGKLIIITDIILTANKNVGVNDATVTIYTSKTEGELIAVGNIIELEMQEKTSLPITGINAKVDGGLYVNAKTDDNDVFITIMFYRVPI